MFAGFNLDLSKNQDDCGKKIIDFSYYRYQGEKHLNSQKADYENKLIEYVIYGTEGIVDGTKLQDDWFPEIEADIFISHSHKDLELAQGFAGWLNSKFGLKCFIDTNVWGYADKLLDKINADYSDRRLDKDGSYLYNHHKCNIASKHVNVMLSIALQKMIDKLEATFVINTTNSVQRYADVHDNKTYSPWIYTEIICTEIIRKKSLSEYRKMPINKFAFESAANEYKAAYTIPLKHLIDIDSKILLKWEKDQRKPEYPLDILYILTDIEEVKELKNVYNNDTRILLR